MRIVLALLLLCFAVVSCKTKSEVRREQEIERLRGELRDVKSDKSTDAENVSEEMKVELGKLNNLVEERAVNQRRLVESLKDELRVLEQKIVGLEQKVNNIMIPPAVESRGNNSSDEEHDERAEDKKPRDSFQGAKKLFQDKQYEDAAEMFRAVSRKGRGEEQKKATFWVGESLFFANDHANAALEFGEFQKKYPKDPLASQAVYRQASCFKKMNRNKEAKLFFQELLEKYPKSPQAAKAKAELKRLK